MDLSAANTLGDQQGQRCIQIWELLYQIISRVPLGGGGLNCSVICNYLGQAPLSLGFPRQGYWIFPTQGLNSCLLHWRVGYQLSHQGSKFYPTGKGPYRVNCSRVWPHVHPEACMCCQPHLTLVVALPVHIHWAKLTALSSCRTPSSSPAPVPGCERLPLPAIPLPPSMVSLQFSFIIHTAWQFLPCSRCLVWSLWFPPTTLTLVVPLISKQNHNVSQLPLHPFIPLVFVVWGFLPVDSEWDDEHSCISDSLRNVCQSHLEKINISASVAYHDPSSEFM